MANYHEEEELLNVSGQPSNLLLERLWWPSATLRKNSDIIENTETEIIENKFPLYSSMLLKFKFVHKIMDKLIL